MRRQRRAAVPSVESQRRLHDKQRVDAVELPPELWRVFAASYETVRSVRGQRQDTVPCVGAEWRL